MKLLKLAAVAFGAGLFFGSLVVASPFLAVMMIGLCLIGVGVS